MALICFLKLLQCGLWYLSHWYLYCNLLKVTCLLYNTIYYEIGFYKLYSNVGREFWQFSNICCTYLTELIYYLVVQHIIFNTLLPSCYTGGWGADPCSSVYWFSLGCWPCHSCISACNQLLLHIWVSSPTEYCPLAVRSDC